MSYVVATDVGGTCTDTVVFSDEHGVALGKALSTPPEFANGVMASIKTAADDLGITVEELFRDTRLFVHGSTVVDNAILTRSGGATALVTTRGFEDTLAMTRAAYGRWGGLTEEEIKHPVKTHRARPLVDKSAILGVTERVDAAGEVVVELDERQTEAALRDLLNRTGAEAVAVSLLWSFANPAHEEKIREIIGRIDPEIYVSLSKEIAPVPGEYERTSTTVINAYTGPVTHAYLTDLQKQLKSTGYEGPVLVMQGYGGLLSAEEAAERSIGMLECGPAAGLIGSQDLGQLMGEDDVIAADMGGTTFKVGVIRGGLLEYAREPIVDRYHYTAPKLDIVSIGAGGGSLVRADAATKSLRIGPESAGSNPGPVCYGLGGTEPALTDVMTLIGYMDPTTFLNGSLSLDVEGARRAFEEKVARPLGLDVEEAAVGVYKVAAAQITDLIRKVTVERGHDPREFSIHAFGGSCALLADAFGAELSVRRVIIPYTASVNCAYGMVASDVVHEFSTPCAIRVPGEVKTLNELLSALITAGQARLREEGFSDDRIELDLAADLRYRRQVHEVTTRVGADMPLDEAGLERLVADFEQLYEDKYGKGSAYKEAGVEIRMVRLTARGRLNTPGMVPLEEGPADPAAALIGTKRIYALNADSFVDGRIYRFEALKPGNVIEGAAVILTPITTIVVQDGHRARMDPYRNIVIEF
ncbi:MAG: hydantoinase/oxoprolinase family protein [Alphaproteobacteria bacterium]